MDAPKCKICGERHYGVCRSVSDARRELEPASLNTGKTLDRIGATSTGAKFDRTAYQREYMRKRRAAKAGDVT